jgi:hypothetical protein
MFCGKGRSQWSLAGWGCGFESRQGHGRLSVVIVVCCHAEVPATGWSLVQRSHTECGVAECDLETSTMSRLRPTRVGEPWKKIEGRNLSRVSNHLQLGADRLSKGQRVNNKYSTIHSSCVKLCTLYSCVCDNYWYHALTDVLITIFAISHLRIHRVKLTKNRSHRVGKVGWGCLRIGCWGEYLGLRGTR